ncbi:MAG: hypothetical protein H0X66_08120 [Verrucomicrobia bacterium]|nr:hypothetical protein [Verrucomicrobiota bacterium]
MSAIRLPDDLVTFLSKGLQLDYDGSKCEPGHIKLLAMGAHTVGEVWIEPDNDSLGDQNPHAGEDGYYAIPAVNLVAESEAYDPEFILLWLPEACLYGTWDSDHWDLRVFPGITWMQIAASPLKYVNAQWDPDSVDSKVFVPWPQYPFKKGRPF